MTMEVVVSPARSSADRRTPERFAEDAADHAASHRTDRTGNDEAGSCSGRSANPIRARTSRRQSKNGKRRSRNKLAHACPPRTPMHYRGQHLFIRLMTRHFLWLTKRNRRDPPAK
jgi:hypothetical protein